MNAHMVDPMPEEDRLSAAENLLRLALTAGKMGIWELSVEAGSHMVLSPEFQAILDLRVGEFDGQAATLLDKIYPADRTKVLRAFARALRDRKDPQLEVRFSRSARPPGWLLARGHVCEDAEGRPIRLIGVGVDITAQKRVETEILRLNAELERRVSERTTQLRATEKELEAFCYSVSHDLRAPLRSIRGFNEVLLERYASNLDARGQEFLRRACESSHYMDVLIDDLLKLSRIGRAELVRGPVNLSELARVIAETLHHFEPLRAVSFEITPNLRAAGDERLLRIVLENLLRNAWKFTSKRAKARIEFGFTSAPENAFFVRDNGAGFDRSYAGRLFGAFQRLHAASEFEGTGVGLATVQRIINRHGGRVWAEGDVDRGATFYFAMPSDEVI
jgi:signal transduction histidine kinase